MYLFLLEPQNIIIQDHDQGQEKENGSQVRHKFSLLIKLMCILPIENG
jgi:hypothetical protein